MSHRDDWLEQLPLLVWRFQQLGVDADMSSLTLTELWGVYCVLSRYALESGK
jgi:hypothetical protein